MDEEKKFPFETGNNQESEGNVPRARNRTVMLTPEMTGQVRARLAQENSGFQSGFSLPQQNPSAPKLPEPQGFSPNTTVQHQPKVIFESGKGKVQPTHQHDHREDVPVKAPPVQKFSEGLVWVKESPIVGFMVSFDSNENGEFYPLRVGRLIITSEASTNGGNYLLINDESVSPMHAILRIGTSGDIQVLDQLSEFGTKIRHINGEEEQLSGEKGTLHHGDVVFFGNRSYCVCIIEKA